MEGCPQCRSEGLLPGIVRLPALAASGPSGSFPCVADYCSGTSRRSSQMKCSTLPQRSAALFAGCGQNGELTGGKADCN
jgi:hypothetical protein